MVQPKKWFYIYGSYFNSCGWKPQPGERMYKINKKDNVVELEEYRKVWTYCFIVCQHCKYEYMSVHHKDSKKVECPQCGKMTKVLSEEAINEKG